jgi:PAS domain S-box-containing protein
VGLFKKSQDIDIADKSVYTNIFSAIEDGVILFNSKGVIRLFNAAASKISGWDAKDALSLDIKTVIKLIDPKGEQYKDIDNPFTKVLTLGQPVKDNKAILIAKSGQQTSVNVGVFPLKSSDKVSAAVAIIRNVTEERKEEERLADFISTASHEMRTPVAAIEGYLALALNERVASVDTRAKDYLEKAHASTQSLGVLFQDLLTSAKAEDGRLTSHPTVIEVGSFMKQVTEEIRFSAEKKGLKTEFNMGSSNVINTNSAEQKIAPLYYAYADPNRLKEVLINLFDNAVKFTNEGQITLGITGDDSVVQLYIRDTGAGIPKEDIPHLFQKFYRVDNSATRTVGGTGLGLYICQKIIELYNGRIWVESELSKGSTFYINLPRLTTQQATSMQSSSGTSDPWEKTETEVS